jgi:tetratricopeptide (TPR) repeat protein
MAYDSGLHGLAQRYFIQALGFADAAGDRLLGASVLDAMSHQASFLGRHREAANMARAAALGTKNAGTPLLSAHFHIMEARALARIGGAVECDRAMGNAALEFDRQKVDDNPAWLAYFDAAELSAEMAHCHRDLGRPDRAIEFATRALRSASGDYARSDFFVALVLADAHLDRGDIDKGCEVAARALDVGQELDSVRCRSYVDEFKIRLQRHSHAAEVRELQAAVSENHLWRGIA